MLSNLTIKKDIRTFSVSPENPTGEKGKGGIAIEGTGAFAARELGRGWKINPYLICKAGQSIVLADIEGQGSIKHIWMTDNAKNGRQLLLRIYFDGHQNPAVEAPLSDFFACADITDYRQLTSLAICVNPRRALNCYFEMPYRNGFRIEVENIGEEETCIFYQIDCEEKNIPQDSLYFHAQFRRVKEVPYKEPYVILDNIRGCGHYVGTYLHWGTTTRSIWCEGEVKFYLDGDTDFPSICGTGTEDYFCGSYSFTVNDKHTEFSTPYAGMPKVKDTDGTIKRIFDLYRWHITDPIYFFCRILVF